MTGNYSTREYREKLYDDLHVRLSNILILMCSIFIASIGLNMNSTAVVIGAMLISPLMTPIAGLGFGLAIFDTRLIEQSLKVLFTQVLVSLLVSALYFWISPLSYASSQLIARNIKIRIGLISLIVLLVLPASYSAVTLTMNEKRKQEIKQFVGKEFANYTVINQVYESSNNELVLTVVGDPISEEELETIRQKQASYGIESVQLKVKQFHNSEKLDSETIKEFYENIDKYIEQKLSEKNLQNDRAKENEADNEADKD